MKRARALREAMSLPEVLLWRVLRTRPEGLKFRRQFPVGSYVADFACLEARLAIEVDGEAHSRGDQPARDAIKDIALQSAGFDVLRVPAVLILGDLDNAVAGIVARCREVGPLHRPAGGPPPRSGEDKTTDPPRNGEGDQPKAGGGVPPPLLAPGKTGHATP